MITPDVLLTGQSAFLRLFPVTENHLKVGRDARCSIKLRPKMKRMAFSIVFIVFLLTFGSFAHAQSGEWDRLNNEARLLYLRAQYDQAIVLMKEALEVALKEW